MARGSRALYRSVTLLDPRSRAGDAVSELLDRLHFSVRDYRRLELRRGTPASFVDDGARFHFVAEGTVDFVGIATTKPLRAGDFLILPRGGAYDAVPLGHAVLQSGALELGSPVGSTLLAQLPDFVLACSFVAKEPFVAALLEAMSREACTDRPGAASVVSRLANVVATAAIRTWLESGCADTELLTVAVRDADVARAVAAIHRDPGRAWTVDSLARVALASRSMFAERFREATGEPPARYLARVRMEHAKQLLQQPSVSVAQVATSLGYGSDAAFSRAFRRFAGVAPTAWRRTPAVG